jgi:hypothetical protein
MVHARKQAKALPWTRQRPSPLETNDQFRGRRSLFGPGRANVFYGSNAERVSNVYIVRTGHSAKKPETKRAFIGGRSRIRTYDPLIKSQLLYQLSYAPAPTSAGF